MSSSSGGTPRRRTPARHHRAPDRPRSRRAGTSGVPEGGRAASPGEARSARRRRCCPSGTSRPRRRARGGRRRSPGCMTATPPRIAGTVSGNGKSSGKIPGIATGAAGLPGCSVTTHSASAGNAEMQCAAVRNARSESTEPLHKSAGGVGPAPSTSNPEQPDVPVRCASSSASAARRQARSPRGPATSERCRSTWRGR